jgi:hypothetical protein
MKRDGDESFFEETNRLEKTPRTESLLSCSNDAVCALSSITIDTQSSSIHQPFLIVSGASNNSKRALEVFEVEAFDSTKSNASHLENREVEAEVQPKIALLARSSVLHISAEAESVGLGRTSISELNTGEAAVASAARSRVSAASSDPNFYKNACGYSAEVNNDLEDIYSSWDSLVPDGDAPLLEDYVRFLLAREVKTAKDVEKAMGEARRQFKGRRRSDGTVQDIPRKSEILKTYMRMVQRGDFDVDMGFQVFSWSKLW